MVNDSTPIWHLTVAEFRNLMKEATAQEPRSVPVENNEEYIYGIAGLAELLKCSRTTAQKLKSSGRIDKAITQVGRQIIINKKTVLNILKQQT